MRIASYVLVTVLVAAASWGATAWTLNGGQVVGPSQAQSPSTLEMSYSDFVSILLTALGLILAALAIVIGIVAFRTIGEIKREAGRIAEQHSKSEVENSLQAVPDRVATAVQEQVSEHLPSAIDEAVERLGKEGRLDEALQKAMMQFTAGGGVMNEELQPGFENPNDEENPNA